MKAYIGIDNGVTGSVGIITGSKSWFYLTPVKKEQSYTKKKQNITRIDTTLLKQFLNQDDWDNEFVLIERPMVNGKMFKSSMSAIRSLEATLCVLEGLGYPFQYIDSKEWQRALLPIGTKGTAELKKASVDIGCRLFPQHREQIKKHGDADALLIAEYCRRNF